MHQSFALVEASLEVKVILREVHPIIIGNIEVSQLCTLFQSPSKLLCIV